jgi:hypothetical protein
MAIAILTSNESGANSLIDINANFADLDTTKADLASPTFTGVPVAPTATGGTNTTQIATTAFVLAAGLPTVETTAGATHSLTTTAGQKVIVWAKSDLSTVGGTTTVTLKYDGVTKDTISFDASGDTRSLTMMYTEIPGAATANIVLATDVGSLSNTVIIVMKIG